MALSVYLDTSVLSAINDQRYPDRARLTEAFWKHRAEYNLHTSEITRIELEGTPDQAKRILMLALLDELELDPITSEMESLARQYVDAKVFGESMINDALHVAAAVLLDSKVLLSWNFKHLVNRNRRSAIQMVNSANNLPSIEIIAPPEL